ncbi:Isoprenylcysteine carboxylmethyltransferase family protein [Deinococcus saxicola]|uniref:methyltransferase family protein n=1 Tax=Deinococcus saxicola TaxID=249406 RepID=UPI0039F00F9F
MKGFAFWTALLGAAGSFMWVRPRIEREYREEGHLLELTVGVVYAAYGLHLAAFLLAISERRAGKALPALSFLGWTTAGLGAALFVSGWRTLPVSDDSALTTSGLKTEGVYQLSRNPQNVGWAILFLGTSLARRSWAGAGLTALFGAMFLRYLPDEEVFLEQTYGDAYRRYRARTPRILGWPSP